MSQIKYERNKKLKNWFIEQISNFRIIIMQVFLRNSQPKFWLKNESFCLCLINHELR